MTPCILCGATALYRVNETGYCRTHYPEAKAANAADYAVKYSAWAATVRDFHVIGSLTSKRRYASGRRSVV